MPRLLRLRAAAPAACLLLVLMQPASAQIPRAEPAPTPDLQCLAMEPYVAAANQGMPQPTGDGTTDNIAIRLDCAGGTITYVKRFTTDPATLGSGWQTIRQALHTATYCAPDGATSRYGLVAIDELHGPDDAIIATFTTTPADCARVTAGDPLLTPAELDAYLEAQAAALRADLPAPIDNVTTMVSVFHGVGASIYFYQLGFAANDAQLATFQQTAATLHDDLCADPSVRLVIFSGGSLTYRYSDNAGTPVFSVTLAPGDCAAAP